MPEGKKESDRYRSLTLPYELSGHVVDRRDVVGIDSMPKTEGICEKGGSKEKALYVRKTLKSKLYNSSSFENII
jgi:hypothetical protein